MDTGVGLPPSPLLKLITMITKDDYLKLRNANKVSIELAYEYYCLKTTDTTPMSFDSFKLYFSEFYESHYPSFANLFEHFDKKFNVTTVIDKVNNVILKVI